MANGLEVDASGLQVAATSSEVTAAELASGPTEFVHGIHLSQAGVAAILAAAQSVRIRQSQRISGQAANLSVSGARYHTTDSDGADAITVTV